MPTTHNWELTIFRAHDPEEPTRAVSSMLCQYPNILRVIFHFWATFSAMISISPQLLHSPPSAPNAGLPALPVLDTITSLEPWLPILSLLKPPEGKKNQHLLALKAHSPLTWCFGDGIVIFCQVPKLCERHLTAWDSRDMETLGLCSQCLTSLISPLADILTLQRGKIPTEGPVRYPDNKSHIFPKNSNLEFHGGGPKLLECYCLVFPRKLFKPGTFKQQWQSPTQEGLEGSTAVNPVDQGWLEQTRMCQLKETGLQCVPV